MRILCAIIGIGLIPVCVAVSRTVVFLLASLGAEPGRMRSVPVLAVGVGVAVWLLLFYILPKPVRTYVLAHELTHALWGSIFGARVSGLRLSKTGGSVKVSELNVFTALAPYFFPLYTVLVVLVYYLLALFVDLRAYDWLWCGMIGLTLGFHWTFTLESLAQPQSDIRHYGRLFSYTLIYLLNILGLGLLLVLVSSVSFDLFVSRLIQDIIGAWTWCGAVLWHGVQWVARWLPESSQ